MSSCYFLGGDLKGGTSWRWDEGMLEFGQDEGKGVGDWLCVVLCWENLGGT